MNGERTDNHNSEVSTTFGDNLMPLSQFDTSVCSAGTVEILSQTWLGRLPIPMPSRRCRVGRVGQATGTLMSKTQAPAKSFEKPNVQHRHNVFVVIGDATTETVESLKNTIT